jgi:uncharacterized protein (DUF924 family)
MDARAQEILDYWIRSVGPAGWYAVDPALDGEITRRFGALWEEGRAGRLEGWTCQPETSLAYVVLLDQFPRNMFRGDARAFATDRKALGAAKTAIANGFDERVPLPERQFYYLPLMHSERLADQDRCVRLVTLNFGIGPTLDHARAHRDVIRRFGRFPYRNAALRRTTNAAEQAFLDAGGYEAALRAVAVASAVPAG